MEISTSKIKTPDTCEVDINFNDIAIWFRNASVSEIHRAIDNIGLELSKRDFKNVSHEISLDIAPRHKDFWKSLVEKMYEYKQ